MKWSRQSVNRLVKKIEDTGSTSRQSGSGTPRTACTDENIDNVETMIQSQEDLPGTHHPQRKIARGLGVIQSSVSRLAHKLKLKAYKRIRVSRRDEKVTSKRKTRCRLLLNRFTAEKVKNIIFTDEKDFTLEVARKRQSDRVYGKRKRDIAPNRLYHETSRFTKKVMVSAGVSWKGKTRIHFIDTERTKVNSERYKNLLEIGLLSDCRRLYPNGYFNKMELQLTRARPLRNILMELGLTLFEKMSGLHRAQIATRWIMRSGTRCLKRFMPGNRTNSQ